MEAMANTTQGPAKMRAHRRATETVCTSCGRGFELAEEIYSCPACGSYHHAACWEASRVCSSTQPADREPAAPAPEAPTGSVKCPKCGLINPATAAICDCGYAFPVVSDAQPQLVCEDEQLCRFCGKMIKKEALKCRHCGKVLDNRLADTVANPAKVDPPGLHWLVVLLLHFVTGGLFTFIWLARQSRWAKKADPSNHSTLLVVGSIVLLFASAAVGEIKDLAQLGGFLSLAAVVCFQLGSFGVKKAMEHYYNRVEPVHLKLSGGMTFFFSVFYFQYHFRRIAMKREADQLSLRIA